MTDFISRREFFSQGEVAERFGVTASTVKNWRDKGIFTYVLFPGSNRPFYSIKEIEEAEKQSTIPKKGVVKQTNKPETKRKKPEISSNPQKEWRI